MHSIVTWLWYSIPMLKVLMRIARRIPCWKYLCSTSFLIHRLTQRNVQIQQLPALARNRLAREDFCHFSPSSGHWSPPGGSQQQEQLSTSDVNHCVRSSNVIWRSVIPVERNPACSGIYRTRLNYMQISRFIVSKIQSTRNIILDIWKSSC